MKKQQQQQHPTIYYAVCTAAHRIRQCQRKRESLNLSFSPLWSRLGISTSCHVDADAAALGGMIDQRRSSRQQRPGPNRPPQIPSTTRRLTCALTTSLRLSPRPRSLTVKRGSVGRHHRTQLFFSLHSNRETKTNSVASYLLQTAPTQCTRSAGSRKCKTNKWKVMRGGGLGGGKMPHS